MKMASRLVAALAAVAMLLVGGCAGNNPRLAATVGTVNLLETDVDAVAKAVSEAAEGQTSAGAQRSTVLAVMIHNVMLAQAARDKGITVSDVERDAQFAAQPFYAALRANPASTKFINEYIDSMIVLNIIGEDAFHTIAQGIPVTVNPRYGTWNQTLSTLNGDSGSLSKPAPTVNPAATR